MSASRGVTEGRQVSTHRTSPHDAGLLAWQELNDEQKQQFIEGCDLFDEAQFWHAHESWEDLWNSLKPMGRPIETDAIQGIIQCAALLYNYERRKVRGVVNMASKLLARLSGVQHGIWGIDVAQLRLDLLPYIRDAAEADPSWDLNPSEVRLGTR